METDTIFALASGSGRAGVAVLRCSGPQAHSAAQAIAGRVPTAHRARLRRLRDANGHIIDEALVLFMPGGHSFTGEDVVEFHIHGSPAVVAALSSCLISLNLRPAAAGEFTRRAFLNGRIDLLQAEAIADLVDAETEAQRQQAVEQLGGSLSGRIGQWHAQLLKAAAFIEADIDFPDEADIGEGQSVRALEPLAGVREDMLAALRASESATARRSGFEVALIGRPNAGKSTLFNALINEDRAIVTDIAGTTRDIVDATRIIGGHLVSFRDTAGLHDASDPVEREGIRRARQAAERAHRRILVVGPDDGVTEEMRALLRDGDYVWWSRQERSTVDEMFHVKHFWGEADHPAALGSLRSAIATDVEEALAFRGAPELNRQRHVASVRASVDALEDAMLHIPAHPELAGDSVRRAADSLAFLIGQLDVEHILDQIFGEFCIGK